MAIRAEVLTVAVTFLLVLLATVPATAVRPPAAFAEQVRILAAQAVMELPEEVTGSEGPGWSSPPPWRGRVVFSVESPLPAWGVAVELGPVTGPEGAIPPEKIWLRCPPAESERVPAMGGAIVAVGQAPVPASEVGFVIEIQPTWLDAPGPYRGVVKLIPFAGMPGGEGKSVLETAPFLGRPTDIPLDVNLPEITMVASLSESFTLQAGTGFGRFEVTPDMNVVVASNAAAWEVRLAGSSFTDGEHEIPLSRVLWSRVDATGRAGSWTALGQSNVLLAGEGRRGVFEERFRLALEVTMADPAGQYGASLQLVSSSGQ